MKEIMPAMEMNEAALIQSAAVAMPLAKAADAASGHVKALGILHPRTPGYGQIDGEGQPHHDKRPQFNRHKIPRYDDHLCRRGKGSKCR
jgi:hypothetical protein